MEMDVMTDREAGVLPEGWEWKPILDVLELNRRSIVPKLDEEYNIIGLENIERDSGKLVDFKSTYGRNSISSKVPFEKGMILYGKLRPYLNKVWLAEFDGIATTEILPFKAKKNIILPEYAAYFLRSESFLKKVIENCSGARMPRLTTKFWDDAEIPLPSPTEQQRIVQKLDALFARIDEAVALSEAAIHRIQSLLPAALNEVFGGANEKGWETDSLKSLTTKIGSGSTPTGGNNAYKSSGISLVRSMNVYDEGFEKDGLAFIDDQQAAKLSNVVLEENDVLLNITGASVARCCIIPKNILPARVNQHVSILRVNQQKLLPEFLHYFLICPEIKFRLLKDSGGGATREAITKSMLEVFLVSFPQPSVQQSITARLNSVNSQKATLEAAFVQKLSQLKALKRSLLDVAFTGVI